MRWCGSDACGKMCVALGRRAFVLAGTCKDFKAWQAKGKMDNWSPAHTQRMKNLKKTVGRHPPSLPPRGIDNMFVDARMSFSARRKYILLPTPPGPGR